ncbi:MAG: ATP-binding protein, partial [FCB group bacterium]|jgi:signal transduction histidine kinase|nr:ATP-binding protein [FCB group bacterium]
VVCAISGDRSQIRQVFLNIAKNGIEAMGEQGELSMVVTRRATSIDVVFDDKGPGIEPDKVARIFEPFYTTKESGVGMGLAICLRIITAHDGTVRVTSREGGGTSMTVRLPVAQREAARALEASLAQPPVIEGEGVVEGELDYGT